MIENPDFNDFKRDFGTQHKDKRQRQRFYFVKVYTVLALIPFYTIIQFLHSFWY